MRSKERGLDETCAGSKGDGLTITCYWVTMNGLGDVTLSKYSETVGLAGPGGLGGIRSGPPTATADAIRATPLHTRFGNF